MNPETLLRLCSFTYLDLPEGYIRRLARGETVPLAEAARALRRLLELGALSCGAYLENAGEALSALERSRLRILAYENDNDDTGFVAYAFGGRGETIVSVRGSESRSGCVPTNVDWRDNFCAPVAGSVQYAAATAFADRYADGSVLLTGHSKGGNVALYAQSVARNPLARAAVFNAQGFARCELDRTQKRRLRAGAVNYVVAGDIVGALLYHPETRFYVRQNPGTNAHSPDAYAFNAAGWPVPARRTWLSRAVEALSRLLLAVEKLGAVKPVRRLLACPDPA
ncbi:MAG TPA: DUF2974 domain-containing protein [Candidatus Pullichristensenella avicola]|nr:DUF2974 domain-containing protein [Candidatus Pullichristensenella avicola]